MKSTMTYSELIPCCRKRFARKKYLVTPTKQYAVPPTRKRINVKSLLESQLTIRGDGAQWYKWYKCMNHLFYEPAWWMFMKMVWVQFSLYRTRAFVVRSIFSNEVFNEYPKWSYSGDLMECEGSHFSTGGHFSPPGLGVMTRFLQTKNDPFGRRKWTPGHFST